MTEMKLYFGSKTRIAIGTILRGRPVVHQYGDPEEDLAAARVEQALEDYRPAGALSRNESVFMVDRPDGDLIERVGGYARYIYEVRPIGRVSRNDPAWWAELLNHAYDPIPDDVASDLATRYFAGQPRKVPTNWEYRTRSAEVIRQVYP